MGFPWPFCVQTLSGLKGEKKMIIQIINTQAQGDMKQPTNVCAKSS